MTRVNACLAWFLVATASAGAAEQASESYRIVADVFCDAQPALAIGSARAQTSLSVSQRALAGEQSAGQWLVEVGYQATTEGFDTDRDGIPDWMDEDTDGDGVPDTLDALVYDTDNDGLNNMAMDDDDDGDRLTDWEEDVVTLTDPLDPNDCLKVLGLRRTGSHTILRWAAKPGKEGYRLQRAMLLDHRTNWQDILTMASTGMVVEATDSNAPPRAFYRITLPK